MAKDGPTVSGKEEPPNFVLTQIDLNRQTAKSLESCARFICILKILHTKQQGLPRVPLRREGFLAPFTHGRYFIQMLPNVSLDRSIWISDEKLNILTVRINT